MTPLDTPPRPVRHLFDDLSDSLKRARALPPSPDLPARQAALDQLTDWLTRRLSEGAGPAALTVICTHNSRRSHMGQFWLAALGHLYGLPIAAFSGGTEVTACHPNTLAALSQAGARITRLSADVNETNPVYEIHYAPDEAGIVAFSKPYHHEQNPSQDFAALLVCTEADGACPFVPGASGRFLLPYRDPKHADNTPGQEAAYELTLLTIAAELDQVISQVATRLSGTPTLATTP